jgi:hypothetical protein
VRATHQFQEFKMDNLNIVKIFENIIIDNDTRIKIQDYYQMQNVQAPNFVRFEKRVFEGYDNSTKWIQEQLDQGFRIRDPHIARPEIQEQFYTVVGKIFETSSVIKPILTKYIFEYHVVDSPDDKNYAMNSLMRLITEVDKGYNDSHLTTPTEKRYVDGGYNLNPDKLTNAMERRIEEIFKMAQESNITGDDREVFRILKKYNLL